MNARRSLFAVLLLPAWLAMQGAGAQAQEGEWLSYRDAYRAMVVFEKYGKPKHFLQNHFQIIARDGATLDGLRLTLNARGSQLNLPLDAAGRAVFPLLKAAYDDNAVLMLNRKLSGYAYRPRVSIMARADGVYEAADLRTACEQAQAYQRVTDAAFRGGRCVGVRFAFARRGEAQVRLRHGAQDSAPLPVAEGPAFADGAGADFSIVSYRFDAPPAPGQAAGHAAGQVISLSPPLAIAPLYE
ncbi:hypothetical protein ASD15_24985 [Massilia sp. Root351]|uniref:hypothetical protein n=1 Tax=Massilia sp. Root351 TaxID=1736522 RepID=UPI0007092459|nr:hypothetical protein [Massilia sp. Root351]KQV89951.1 hypothetical protein ASD15_24985 [Massilia sp. Root351]